MIRWDDENGKVIIRAAADLWSGSEIPDWRDNEYCRGQVELIMDSVRLFADDVVDRVDGEEVKDRALSLMRRTQPVIELPTMTEAVFKERWAGFEGDALSQGKFNVIVQGWPDVTETPSERISRLNTEVIDATRYGSTRHYRAKHVGDLGVIEDDGTDDVWWVELELLGDDTQGTAYFTLSDVEAIELGQNLITTALTGRVEHKAPKEGT